MKIIPYRPSMLDDLAGLWHRSWGDAMPRLSGRISPAELRARFVREAESRWQIMIAVQEETPLGFAALVVSENLLDQLFVDTAQQGRGVGTALLDSAKEELPNGLWLRAALENKATCRFYERQGFTAGEISVHPRLGHPLVTYKWTPAP